MKKIFLYLILFLTLFSSHSFGELSFVQTKDVTSDTPGVRGINFKPDGKIMYITSRLKDSEDAYVVQYSLSTPFDISTATRSFSDGDGTQLTCSTNMKLPHAIEFKPDGTKMFVATNKDFSGNPGVAIFQFKLTTAWDSSTLVCEKIYEVNEIGVYVENQLRTLAFKPDGTRMFVGGKNCLLYTSPSPRD